MFFVLSTGRAGSRTVASVLSQSPNCECLHEPEPRLITETVQFRYGEISRDEMATLLAGRGETLFPDRVYGEANNRMSLVVPALRAAYPEARFVWLVRDGRDFVASADQRGWYHPQPEDGPPNEWEATRLRGDRVGAVSPERWEAWSPFERICWSWTYVNALIRDELAASGADVFQLRLEELEPSLGDLADFLGIDSVPWAIGRHNARVEAAADPDQQAQRVNRVDRVVTWDSWDAERRSRFEEHCGELMDEVYPGWRSAEGTWQATSSGESKTTRDLDEADRDALLLATRADIAELSVAVRELRTEMRLERRSVRRMESTVKRVEPVVQSFDVAVKRMDAAVKELRKLERENAMLRKRVARYETRLWRRAARALRRRLRTLRPTPAPVDAAVETGTAPDPPTGS